MHWNKRVQEWKSYLGFGWRPIPKINFWQRLKIIRQFVNISREIDCQHLDSEMLQIARSILLIPATVKGGIVEAGAFKGGSAAKLSLIARLAKRKLIVFDSFEGLPANKEFYIIRDPKLSQKNDKLGFFHKNQYRGTINEVTRNIQRYGAWENCQLMKGWFAQTMPDFDQPLAAIFLDVDLAASTQTCLKYLYPLLQSGGVLFSHDGHIPAVAKVYEDKTFWKRQVGATKPKIIGLGEKKLLKIIKS